MYRKRRRNFLFEALSALSGSIPRSLRDIHRDKQQITNLPGDLAWVGCSLPTACFNSSTSSSSFSNTEATSGQSKSTRETLVVI